MTYVAEVVVRSDAPDFDSTSSQALVDVYVGEPAQEHAFMDELVPDGVAKQQGATCGESGRAMGGWTDIAQARDWSDGVLRKRVLARDEVAWSELVRRFRGLIYRCINKVTSKHAPDMSSADADEIFAEVLLALFRDDARKLRLYDATRGVKLGSWIGMISVNTAHDFLRGANRRPMLDRIDGKADRNSDYDRTPLDMLIEKERWAHFKVVLSDISDRDRRFVELYYGCGLEPSQVADEMTISIKTVYSKKNKIRHCLRRSVAQIGDGSVIADLAA